MYQLSDQQITFILDDIRRNGIELEDLQLNLLDHICCIIEQELEENGDFEHFYRKTITRFYKKELGEIEEEANYLLQFKHYYAMKKTMLVSGVTSVSMLSLGLILKFLHMPGAGILLVSGIFLLSLLFLPLMMILRLKEKTESTDKLLVVLGVFSAITMSLGVLFKIMYWPGANMLSMISLLNILFIFLPFYFYNGLRKPETKTNTAISGMLIFTGCGLILTLIRAPHNSHRMEISQTKNYVLNEKLLAFEKKQVNHDSTFEDKLGSRIYALCDQLKTFIVKTETGLTRIDENFESQNLTIGDTRIDLFIRDDPYAMKIWEDLKKDIEKYNQQQKESNQSGLPIESHLIDSRECRSLEALSGLIHIQRAVLANEMGR